jgi:PPOX class probable F420-dependent enzyme
MGSPDPTLHHSIIPILPFSVLLTKKQLAFIRSARVAHFATADAGNQPHVVPICFAFDGKYFYSSIDKKPKRTAPKKLKRMRNIQANTRVCLVIDHYDEDWRLLAYVLVFGTARIVLSGLKHRNALKLLRRKYPQYRAMVLNQRPMILITPMKIVSWGRL